MNGDRFGSDMNIINQLFTNLNEALFGTIMQQMDLAKAETPPGHEMLLNGLPIEDFAVFTLCDFYRESCEFFSHFVQYFKDKLTELLTYHNQADFEAYIREYGLKILEMKNQHFSILEQEIDLSQPLNLKGGLDGVDRVGFSSNASDVFRISALESKRAFESGESLVSIYPTFSYDGADRRVGFVETGKFEVGDEAGKGKDGLGGFRGSENLPTAESQSRVSERTPGGRGLEAKLDFDGEKLKIIHFLTKFCIVKFCL